MFILLLLLVCPTVLVFYVKHGNLGITRPDKLCYAICQLEFLIAGMRYPLLEPEQPIARDQVENFTVKYKGKFPSGVKIRPK